MGDNGLNLQFYKCKTAISLLPKECCNSADDFQAKSHISDISMSKQDNSKCYSYHLIIYTKNSLFAPTQTVNII